MHALRWLRLQPVRPIRCSRRYYIIPSDPKFQMQIQNALFERAESSGRALPEAENQPYLYVMADSAAMPVEGSRVRFNFDLARADSFQATVVGHTEV